MNSVFLTFGNLPNVKKTLPTFSNVWAFTLLVLISLADNVWKTLGAFFSRLGIEKKETKRKINVKSVLFAFGLRRAATFGIRLRLAIFSWSKMVTKR